MPIIVIYKNSDYCMIPVIFSDVSGAFTAIENYLMNFAINKCDDDLKDDIEDALCMNDLINIIEDYDIEEIKVYKAYECDPKELK